MAIRKSKASSDSTTAVGVAPRRRTAAPKAAAAGNAAIAAPGASAVATPTVASVSAGLPQSSGLVITHEMIARRAYQIWQSGRGGTDLENWARAERELRGQR